MSERVPDGANAGRVMLGRFAEVEYCADDGGDAKVRYVPGVAPLERDFDSTGPKVELIAGTLELSGDVDNGQNAFKRYEPYPVKLLREQRAGIEAFEAMFDDTIATLALDDEAHWYLVAGAAAEAHLFYGAMLEPAQADAVPDQALQKMRGEGAKPHPRIIVGGRIASVSADERFTTVADDALDPDRYDAITRVIRNFASRAKLGFVVVATRNATERTPYAEAFDEA